MCSVPDLRQLIRERLAAAAEHIFSEFERSIVQFQEEMDRQRRLLGVTWRPRRSSHTADFTEEQHLCDQGRNSRLDQEDPQLPQIKKEQEELCTSLDQEDPQLPLMKEEQEELCISLDVQQLVPSQETYTFMLFQCKSKCEELSGEIFRIFEKTIVRYEEEIDRQRRLLDVIWKPKMTSCTTDFPQKHVYMEEELLAEQQLHTQERISSPDKEEPEPLEMKEEEEELCTSQQSDPLVLKQEMDNFIVTTVHEDSDHSEPDSNSEQLISYNSPVAKSPDQEGGEHADSESSRNAELKPKKRHDSNSSHAVNVDNSPMLESRCDTDTGTKILTCDFCGKAFKHKSNLKIHQRIHTGEKPFTCETCGKSFSQSNHLVVHMRIHTAEKPYACNTCGKRFPDPSAFKRHTAIHTGEKLYTCSTCEVSFSYSQSLKVHMRTHTGEMPYLCNICGKRFSHLSAFKAHTAAHTGEKLHSCTTCGKSFSQSGDLKVHVRIHTGDKPYSCETCGKRFSSTSALKRHTAIHTGLKLYSCETCGKSFSQSGNLKVHMRTHAGETSLS